MTLEMGLICILMGSNILMAVLWMNDIRRWRDILNDLALDDSVEVIRQKTNERWEEAMNATKKHIEAMESYEKNRKKEGK